METIIKYIKLPFSFNAGAMLKEAQALSTTWLSHYNTYDYTGDWKAIPLRSINGSTTNILAVESNEAIYMDTEFLTGCPEIKAAIDSLDFEKKSIRLLNLGPGSVIKEHTDPGLCYEEGEVRLHIPLITNENVEFYVQDEALFPKQGECWYMNFNLKHRLSNKGETGRVHLVIDGVVNDWVHETFAACNKADIKRIPVPEAFSMDDQLALITQLKSMGTETSLQLAKEIEEKLADKQS